MFQGMFLLFLVSHLFGEACGGGPRDDYYDYYSDYGDPVGPYGEEVYQRVHTISPSLLKVQSFSIFQTLKTFQKKRFTNSCYSNTKASIQE